MDIVQQWPSGVDILLPNLVGLSWADISPTPYPARACAAKRPVVTDMVMHVHLTAPSPCQALC
jgi:hypothetical protein